jgi:hypothetical protein
VYIQLLLLYTEVLIQASLPCVVLYGYTVHDHSEVARLVGEGEPVMIRGVLQWLNSIRLVVLLLLSSFDNDGTQQGYLVNAHRYGSKVLQVYL